MKNVALTILALALAPFAPGQLIDVRAYLTGSQEVPPNSSPATGWGMGTYDMDTNTLDWTLSFSGLTAPATAAHFHVAPPGVPGPIAIPFLNFPNATSGLYEATFTLTDTQEAQMLSGLFYANVHNVNFPPGEIRGQLAPVPEPATYALAGAGLLALLAALRRRRMTRAGV